MQNRNAPSCRLSTHATAAVTTSCDSGCEPNSDTVPKATLEPLTAAEVDSLADHVPGEHVALIYVLAYGGLRIGEALALRRFSVAPDGSELTVSESLSLAEGQLHFLPPKTGKIRTVALPAFVGRVGLEHLNQYVDPDPDALVFTDSRGGPIRANNFRRRVFYPAVDEAGIERRVRIHDLRHTTASLMIQAGLHPKIVQDHLGHSSMTVTMDRYGHLYTSDRRKGAEALDAVWNDLHAPVESN